VPAGEATEREVAGVERIVVAAKAGAEQPWLVQAAAELAAQSNAVVDVVSADDLDIEAFSTVPREVVAEPAGRAAEAVAAQLREQGVAATAHTLSGPVVRSVLLFAEERDADLIVCGASTRGPVARRLLGDTSVQLIRRSRRPVLVITPPREDSHGQHDA
jgi:nucleotide-binding universal stress UspA family protein